MRKSATSNPSFSHSNVSETLVSHVSLRQVKRHFPACCPFCVPGPSPHSTVLPRPELLLAQPSKATEKEASVWLLPSKDVEARTVYGHLTVAHMAALTTIQGRGRVFRRSVFWLVMSYTEVSVVVPSLQPPGQAQVRCPCVSAFGCSSAVPVLR